MMEMSALLIRNRRNFCKLSGTGFPVDTQQWAAMACHRLSEKISLIILCNKMATSLIRAWPVQRTATSNSSSKVEVTAEN